LTEDGQQVILDYYTPNPDAFISISGFPNFPDDEGHVQIVFDSVIVDELTYSDAWHFELLDDENGVSLERIFFDQKTQDRNNWFSAASAVGYATPAYLNSQHNQSEPTGQQITVEPEVFSPDQDGYNDLLFIKYRFAEPGYSGSIFIFDSKGRIVKTVANNELFGIEGQFTWDGIHDDGLKAAIGIYIVYAEVFNLKGNVEHYKIRCVVAGRL
jgi:CHU_C Type IX secretion signal domain